MEVKLNPPASDLPRANAIFAGRALQHYVAPMAGSHSLKAVLEGAAVWTVEGKSRSVTPDRLLTVNEGEIYSLTIESDMPVQTCCAFFAPGYLEGLKASLGFRLGGEVELVCRLEPANTSLLDRLTTVWRMCVREDALAAEAAMLDLGSLTLGMADQQAKERNQIPVAKETTRRDLFPCLNISRDFILENLGERLTLEAIAEVACLTPFHFHRLFRSSFGMPVSRYVREQRLYQAARALSDTETPVELVGLDVGYESPTAFSRAFRSQHGHCPRTYREQFRKGSKVSS